MTSKFWLSFYFFRVGLFTFKRLKVTKIFCTAGDLPVAFRVSNIAYFFSTGFYEHRPS